MENEKKKKTYGRTMNGNTRKVRDKIEYLNCEKDIKKI